MKNHTFIVFLAIISFTSFSSCITYQNV